MKNAAAIVAQVVDIQNDRQHKGFIKVTLHVPAEQGATLTESLGWPTYTDPVSVAIARLDPNKIGAGSPRESGQVETNDRLPVPRKPVAPDKRLAQRAGILCGEPLFQQFLRDVLNQEVRNAEDAATYVRAKCGVTSRSEIVPGSDAAIAYDELYAQFIVWRDADQYVEAAE